MSEQINLQEAILQETCREKVPVTLFLMNGFQLTEERVLLYMPNYNTKADWGRNIINHLLIIYKSAFVVVVLIPSREDMKIGFVVVFTQFPVIGSFSLTWKQFIRFPREIILIVPE